MLMALERQALPSPSYKIGVNVDMLHYYHLLDVGSCKPTFFWFKFQSLYHVRPHDSRLMLSKWVAQHNMD